MTEFAQSTLPGAASTREDEDADLSVRTAPGTLLRTER